MFRHKELGLILSVYVDDFKLAGRKEHLQKGWDLIRSKITLDPPTDLGDYLGCGQFDSIVDLDDIKKRGKMIQNILIREPAISEADKETSIGQNVLQFNDSKKTAVSATQSNPLNDTLNCLGNRNPH